MIVSDREIIQVDAETGEILGVIPAGSKTYSLTELEKNKQYYERRAAEALSYKKYGNFVWGKYQIFKPYANVLSNAMLVRLMYLATYMDYDGYIIDDFQPFMGKQYLSKLQIQAKLKLPDSTFNNLILEFCKLDLLRQIDGRWKLSPKMFRRGEVQKPKLQAMGKKNCYIARIYASTVRTLYEHSKITTHVTLGYVFKMLPYLNRKFNVLCHNPLEEDIDKVKFMKMGDFCDLVGYARSHSSRLFGELQKIEITTVDGKQYIVRQMSNKEVQKGKRYIFISPYLFYAYDDQTRSFITKLLDKKTEEE